MGRCSAPSPSTSTTTRSDGQACTTLAISRARLRQSYPGPRLALVAGARTVSTERDYGCCAPWPPTPLPHPADRKPAGPFVDTTPREADSRHTVTEAGEIL